MNYTIFLFFMLAIPYIGYAQNASEEIAGTYVSSKSTGWHNSTDPSTGESIEVVPLPISETTLILRKNGTFARTIKMFSGGETEEEGEWSTLQDSLILNIKTSKLSFTNYETTSNLEERLKIDTGSRLLIGNGEVYSKSD